MDYFHKNASELLMLTCRGSKICGYTRRLIYAKRLRKRKITKTKKDIYQNERLTKVKEK